MKTNRFAAIFEKVTLTVWASYFVVYWSRAYMRTNEGGIAAQSLGTWADGAAHLTYISSMAYQQGFPEFLPTFWGKPFIYPFVSDGLSALLVRLGLSIFDAYSLIGIVLSLALLVGLREFFYSFTQDKSVTALSLHFFFLSGGLGFIFFLSDWLQQGHQIWSAIPREYTRLDEYHVLWLNIITGELIPQRALLLGLVLGLLIVRMCWRIIQKQSVSPITFLGNGVIYGLLPLIHAHTLIALAPLLAVTWVTDVVWRRREVLRLIHNWLLFGAPALVLAGLIIFGHVLPATDQSFLRWYPGWLAKTTSLNWVYFWWLNWGFFGLFSIWGVFYLKRSQLLLIAPFIFTFVLANLWLFQPYDWDNSKVLTWVYLMFAPVVAQLLVSWWRKKWWTKMVVSGLIILICFSGFVDVVRQLQAVTTVPMYSATDLALAEFVKTNTPRDALFLTGDYHVHPIPTLTGRQIMMGYRGWLWTYGIDYASREAEVISMYQADDDGIALLRKYGVDYLFIGNHEREHLNPNLALIEQEFSLWLELGQYRIYQTNLD